MGLSIWCFANVSVIVVSPRTWVKRDMWWGRTLQYFEILQVCILGVRVELYPRHGDIVEDAVEYLAQRRTGVGISLGRPLVSLSRTLSRIARPW